MQNQHKFVVFCLLFFVGTLHLYLEVWKTQNNCYQQGILLKHHSKFISIILTSYRCLHKKQQKKTYYETTSVLNSTIPWTKMSDWQNALPEKPYPSIHSSLLPLITHLSTPINLAICWGCHAMRGTTKTCREHMWDWVVFETWIWTKSSDDGNSRFLE